MTRAPLSACVITYNEADRIEDCVRSLAFCDEVVVVDSGSTDDTRERAAALGARVLVRPFDGYRSQKAFAVAQAAHDWVLCLDADERVSPALRASIEARRDAGFADAAGYRCNRLSEYFGAYLRHGNAYPDRVLRLFDRRRGGWRGEREIHEKVGVDGPVARLGGDLLHHPYRSFSELVAKQEKYALMMAQHDHAAGRRVGWWQLLLNPGWRFVRGYVLRGGFLDGWRGLLYGLVRIAYVRNKYARQWLLQRGQRP